MLKTHGGVLVPAPKKIIEGSVDSIGKRSAWQEESNRCLRGRFGDLDPYGGSVRPLNRPRDSVQLVN